MSENVWVTLKYPQWFERFWWWNFGVYHLQPIPSHSYYGIIGRTVHIGGVEHWEDYGNWSFLVFFGANHFFDPRVFSRSNPVTPCYHALRHKRVEDGLLRAPKNSRVVGGSSSGRRRVVVGSLIPCLWGKLQNLSFLKVSKSVVMSFCVAGVALCDIPTCLITCQKYQNWRKPRTKCSFCCAHVSRLESLLFLWCRRVYGGSCKTIAKPCLVSSLCFSSGVAVSMGEAAKPRSFCCAHVAVSMGKAAKPQSLLFLWRRRVYGEAAKPRSFCCVESLLFLGFVQAL